MELHDAGSASAGPKAEPRHDKRIERLEAEKAALETDLKRSEERLRRMMDHLPAGTVYLRDNSLLMNRVAEQITGYSRSELTSLDLWTKKLHGADSVRARSAYEAERENGFPAAQLVQIIRKDGCRRLCEFAGSFDGDDEIWIFSDVTDRIASEEKFRKLFEHSSD